MEEEYEYYHNSIYDLYLKESQIVNGGIGVYTNDYIPIGKIIDEYVGDIVSFGVGDYTFCVNEKLYIDAFNFPRCYMGMLNDGSFVSKRKKKKNMKEFENNCEFIVTGNRVFVKSLRDIKVGEELFVSYGEDYWICRDY